MFDEVMMEIEEHFEKSVDALTREFQRLRTGRANPAMVDHVIVEAYGSTMPLKQMASISVPEPTQLLIKPWDKGTLKDIERALIAANLGTSPVNDGIVLRINLPPLSEERRKQLATQAKEGCEKCKVAMRNSRRDGNRQIDAIVKAQKVSEDLVKRVQDDVNKLLKDYEGKADAILKEKTDDLLHL